MCREPQHLPVVEIEHRGIARNPHEPGSLPLGDAFVDGVAAAPSDIDALLTDTGYSLMTLGHQNQYDLF